MQRATFTTYDAGLDVFFMNERVRERYVDIYRDVYMHNLPIVADLKQDGVPLSSRLADNARMSGHVGIRKVSVAKR